MARYADDKKDPKFEEKYNASLITRRRPPVPEYDEKERAYLETHQHEYRCPIVLMINKETGHKIKVSEHDSQRRLELASLGYELDTSTPRAPVAGERIELSSAAKKKLEQDEFEKRVKRMNKKDLIELAKRMQIPAEGTVEELKAKILEKGSEKQDEEPENEE